MNHNLLQPFGNSFERVESALDALRNGQGVLVTNDECREIITTFTKKHRMSVVIKDIICYRNQ